MPIDDAQRAEKVALQQKINQAVIKGTGWNDIPESARRVADTPWFYSFLTFDPQKAMNDTRQPVLIVQGDLDVQVQPHHADKLAEFARARRTKARGRSGEGAGRESPAGARQDRGRDRIRIARARREGVASGDVGDRGVHAESAVHIALTRSRSAVALSV